VIIQDGKIVGMLDIAKRAIREDSIRLWKELTVYEVRGGELKFEPNWLLGL